MYIARIVYSEYDSSRIYETLPEALWYIRDRILDELLHCLTGDERKVLVEAEDDEIMLTAEESGIKIRFSVEDEYGRRKLADN